MNSIREDFAERHPEENPIPDRVTGVKEAENSYVARIAAALTPRRIRAHALILAVCIWGVCAFDYSAPGLFDRAGNLKFQDFLQFPISAHLISQGRARDLYKSEVLAAAIHQITGKTNIDLKYFYGPQVALPFTLLDRLLFATQAEIWIGVSLLLYFGSIFLVYRLRPELRRRWKDVALCSLAYPPLFHFFVRGQLSGAVLLFVALAYLGFHHGHDFLGGLALGCLMFKPQFLVAIPIIFLLAKSWNALVGVILSGAAQFGFSYWYFGWPVMRAYFSMLVHSARDPVSTELKLSAIQMHSLHSFWELLVPSRPGIWALYGLTCLGVIAIAVAIWKSSGPLALRFSALLLAVVLVNPHIYVYDLLALAPMFLLVTASVIEEPRNIHTSAISILLYLAFLLPLFGPLARWTHVQMSVLVFFALLWILYRAVCSAPPVPAPENLAAHS